MTPETEPPTGLKRIVVVDDDEKVRELLARALRPPEFLVTTFSDPRDALSKLHHITPDLIVCDVMMPDMDGRTFFGVVKHSAALRHVPFLFLSAVRAEAAILSVLEAGADDFLVKPFPVSKLVTKIRETLDRGGRHGGAGSVLSPLLDETVQPAVRGDPPAASAPSPAPELGAEQKDDPLGILFDTLVDPDEPSAPRRWARPVPGSLQRPEGRFSTVELNGDRVQVLTEASAQPRFTITTTITHSCRGLRRIEMTWPHPVRRQEDLDLVREQIARQHEAAEALVPEVVEQASRQRERGPSADGALLAWALSLIAEHVSARLSPAMSTALLRWTHERLSRERPALAAFVTAEEARVGLSNAEDSRVPLEAVHAAAAWASELLGRTASLLPGEARIDARDVTRLRADELEALGFYAEMEVVSWA